jgi:E3 ubiquitin-protein ligase RNF38/44
MIVERASLYGSRNMLDQHRDMRLDVDSMSYEVITITVSCVKIIVNYFQIG